MNILYTNFHYGDGGGHTTYIESLLQNTKHTAYVACAERSQLYQHLQAQGFERLFPIEFPFKVNQIGDIWANARLLKRAIEEHEIDIVHTNGSADNRMMLYIKPFLKRPCKVVFTKHNVFPVKGMVSRWRLNSFNDAVIFVGNTINYLQLDASNPKYHIIPNGIDLNHWQRQKPITTKTDKLYFISNAGASKHKGCQHLIEAVAGMRDDEKNRIRIGVLARHRDFMDEAQKVCNFTCLGFHEDVRPYLEEADIGFILSHHEASSFACREMMAMGLPILTSDFPVLLETTDASCRWVSRIGDAESIRDALRAILALSAEDINALKKTAIAHSQEHFSVMTMIEKTNAVYDSLMGTSSAQ